MATSERIPGRGGNLLVVVVTSGLIGFSDNTPKKPPTVDIRRPWSGATDGLRGQRRCELAPSLTCSPLRGTARYRQHCFWPCGGRPATTVGPGIIVPFAGSMMISVYPLLAG